MPFNVTMNKGDTLKIELRRAAVPPEGITYRIEPRMRVILLLNSREVVLKGDNLTDATPGSGLSVTYTFP